MSLIPTKGKLTNWRKCSGIDTRRKWCQEQILEESGATNILLEITQHNKEQTEMAEERQTLINQCRAFQRYLYSSARSTSVGACPNRESIRASQSASLQFVRDQSS